MKRGTFILVIATTLAALGTWAASEEIQPEAEKVALEAVAARLGVDPAELSVQAVAKASFRYLDQTVQSFKIGDGKGQSHGVAVNPKLQVVALQALAAEDDAARRGRLGALDDRLAALLDAGAKEPLDVFVWAADRSGPGAEKPSAQGEALELRAIDELYAAVDARRAKEIEQFVPAVLARVQKYDPAARHTTLSPAIFARLSPEALRALAADPDIDRIYLELPHAPELAVAKQTTGVTTLHLGGTLGGGVPVAAIESGGTVEYGSLYLPPIVQDANNVCPTVIAHATAVASIFRARQFNWGGTITGETGASPNVELRVGGDCGTQSNLMMEASDRAARWGARVLNLSWGITPATATGMDALDRFYDDLVLNRFRTVVKSAGNRNCDPPGNPGQPGNDQITSPGLAYNVITVGAFDDMNTPTWSDDAMYVCSSAANPPSTHGDREKPELVAPGTNITFVAPGPANFATDSGTSFAAPVVSAAAALLIERQSRLSFWPEIVRAVLMATASHNIEGATRLSSRDGAGGLVAEAAADLLGDQRRWNGLGFGCSDTSPKVLTTLSVGPRTRQRVVLSWDNGSRFQSAPMIDIDLEVVDGNGRVVAASRSFDNAYEIVDFDTFLGGTFTLRAVRFSCTQRTWLGWAWHTLSVKSTR